jgi:hypothetical protein
MALPAVVGLASSERHLGSDAATLLSEGHSHGILRGSLRVVELCRQRCLGRRRHAHELLESADGVDASGVVET